MTNQEKLEKLLSMVKSGEITKENALLTGVTVSSDTAEFEKFRDEVRGIVLESEAAAIKEQQEAAVKESQDKYNSMTNEERRQAVLDKYGKNSEQAQKAKETAEKVDKEIKNSREIAERESKEKELLDKKIAKLKTVNDPILQNSLDAYANTTVDESQRYSFDLKYKDYVNEQFAKYFPALLNDPEFKSEEEKIENNQPQNTANNATQGPTPINKPDIKGNVDNRGALEGLKNMYRNLTPEGRKKVKSIAKAGATIVAAVGLATAAIVAGLPGAVAYLAGGGLIGTAGALVYKGRNM